MHPKKPQHVDKTPLIGKEDQAKDSYQKHQELIDHFEMHDNAANDRYIPHYDLDLNYTPPDDAKTGLLTDSLLYPRVVIAAALLLVVVGSAYIYLDTPPNPTITLRSDADPVQGGGLAAELEAIGNRVIKTNHWQNTDIDRFASLWDQLGRNTRIALLQSFWFDQFSFKLTRRANELLRAGFDDDRSIELARKLGVDLAPLATPQKTHTEIADSSAITDEENKKTDKPVDNASDATQKDTASDSNTLSKIIIADVERIPDKEIKHTLNQYSKSYIFGDVPAMEKLFVKSTADAGKGAVANLIQEYKKLLGESTQRWIEFQGLSWQHEKGVATGKGSLLTEYTLQNKDRKSINASVSLELRRDNGEVRIAGFTLSDQQVSIKETTEKKSGQTAKKPSTGLPSADELQAIVTRFVQAYEGGDIKALDSLFAKNIISNKGTTKQDIKKDFENLFISSSERQMNIRDLRWRFGKKHAKGTGTVSAVVVAKDKQIHIEKGKIQFVAKKAKNKVLITHLYQLGHSE